MTAGHDRFDEDPHAEEAELFGANLALIERLIGRVCSQYGVRDADAEDFASTVKLALIDDGYAVLRAWQKKSSLATYLTIVIQRMLCDERNRARGRWEPSAAARRGGEAAVLLEVAVCRDGRPLEQVLPLMQALDPSLSRAEAESMLASFPERARRPRPVALDEADVHAVRAADSADASLLARETSRLSGVATQVVRRTLDALPAEDRTIIRCRFGTGMSIADISRMMRLPQRPLYRKIDALIAVLRRELVAAGIDQGAAGTLVGSSIAALDFDLAGKSDDGSQSNSGGGRGR